MRAFFSDFMTAFDVGVLLYLIAINSCYLLFTVIAFFKLLEHRRRWTPREVAGVIASPATPPISVSRAW